jgi:RND family efflux transporter MFP subunit
MNSIKNNTLAIGMLWVLASCSPESRTELEKLPAIDVQVSKAAAAENDSELAASGVVEAAQSANLSTRLMGYVDEMMVKTGQSVKKGALLISISNSDLLAKKGQADAGVIQAEAGFKNAARDYERFKALFAKNSASQKELDDMTTRYEMAKAGLDAAREMANEVNAQFSYAQIRAPFDGIVTNTFVKQGDMAHPGMPLLSIEGPGKMQVAAMIPESAIKSVHQGMKATVTLKSMNVSLDGVVSEVSLSGKNTGGQYAVKIDLPEEDQGVYAGMYAHVKLHTSEPKRKGTARGVWIPQSALVHQGQLTGVYTIGNENTAILRWLQTGAQSGDEVEVLAGLKAGETYIVSAEARLHNGAKVSF